MLVGGHSSRRRTLPRVGGGCRPAAARAITGDSASTIGAAVPLSIHGGPWVAPIKHGIRVYHKKIDKRSMRKNHMGGAQVQFPVKWATMAKDAGSPVIEILANTSSLSS